MLGDTQHGEGRGGRPDNEITLVAEGESYEVGKLAVYDCDEDGVVRTWLAGAIRAVA